MNSRKILGLGALAVAPLFTFSCGTERQFDHTDSSAGSDGDGDEAGSPGASSGGTNSSGSHSGGGGSEHGGTSGGGKGGSTAGTANEGGSAAGTSEGGAAGEGGASDGGGCPKNSCCVSDVVVERDAVNPDNACLSCQPFRSTSDWSDRTGALCKTATSEVVFPAKVAHLTQSCGEGSQCTAVQSSEPVAEQQLVITPTGPVDALLLTFSNLRASTSLSVTKAEVRFSVKAVAQTQTYRVLAPNAASPICSHAFSTKTYTEIKCDATSVVKDWLTAPESAERTLTITPTTTGNPLMVQSNKAAAVASRPALLIDYAASCEGDRCVTVEK